jgi:hypothetical protein
MKFSITTLCHYAQWHYAECHVLFIVMLNVVMLNVVHAECNYAGCLSASQWQHQEGELRVFSHSGNVTILILAILKNKCDA